MTGRLAAAAAVLALAGCAIPNGTRQGTPGPAPCPGVVVVVDRDERLGCDLRQPHRLDERGHDAASCADAGGTFEAPDMCRDRDY